MMRMYNSEWPVLPKTASSMSLMSSSGEDNDDSASVRTSSNSTGNKQPSALFIHKLYEMACCESHAHIFGFSEDGMSLKIRNPQAMDQVLTKYFKHGMLSSFIRQLNNYGFKTISSVSGNSVQTFAHPYFTRDGKELLDTITRKTARHVKKCKGDIIKELQHVETEYRKRFRELDGRNNALMREIEQLRQEVKRLRMTNHELETKLQSAYELEPVHLVRANGHQLYAGHMEAPHVDTGNAQGADIPARPNFDDDFELINVQGAADRQAHDQPDMLDALLHNDNGWVCTGNEFME